MRGAACAVALALAGCARGPAQPWLPPTKPLVWPLPPDPPRVRYEGAITSGQALRFASRTGFSLLDVLFGRPEITMRTPHGICTDGRIIAIADSSLAAIQVLGLAERRYRVLERAGNTPFRCPVGVATDGAGGLFVADSALAKVYYMTERGKLLAEAPGTFVRPTGLAYDAARGLLHVVDTGAHAIYTFRRDGTSLALVRKIGRRGDLPGDFNFPTHATVDREGNLYVADSLNFRIQIFDPDGKKIGSFGQAGDGTGDFSNPKGVAVDSEGHIYVVDSRYDVVQVFDRTGRCLLAFGGSGRSEGLLWLPAGVSIDSEDRIYVADAGNSRILVYQFLRQSQ